MRTTTLLAVLLSSTLLASCSNEVKDLVIDTDSLIPGDADADADADADSDTDTDTDTTTGGSGLTGTTTGSTGTGTGYTGGSG